MNACPPQGAYDEAGRGGRDGRDRVFFYQTLPQSPRAYVVVQYAIAPIAPTAPGGGSPRALSLRISESPWTPKNPGERRRSRTSHPAIAGPPGAGPNRDRTLRTAPTVVTVQGTAT